MIRKVILKSQANQVLGSIQGIGLNSADFKWGERKTGVNHSRDIVSMLVHSPTGYYFLFEYGAGGTHWAEYSPGDGVSVVPLHRAGAWASQLNSVSKWLNALKREVESPNLWDAISQERKLIEVADESFASNEPFDGEDQKKISANLEEIKQYLLTTTNSSAEQVQLISNQFDYLREASQRVGRKDWLLILSSLLFSQIIKFALQPDIAKELLRFVSGVLTWVISSVGALSSGN